MSYIALLYMFLTFTDFIPEYFILPFLIYYFMLKKIKIRVDVIYFLSFILIVILLNLLFNPEYFNLMLYMHFLFIVCATILIKDKKFIMKKFVYIVKIITYLNFILLFSYIFDFSKEVFFYENLGFYRFRSFYLEPSILALFTVFNMLIIYLYDFTKTKILSLLLNLIILVFTFSGSGIFMFLLVLFSLFYNRIIRIGIIIGIVGFLLVKLNYFPSSFLDRIDFFISGDYDTSTILRFFAPFEFITVVSNENWFNTLFGIGDPGLYLKHNSLDFHLFYLWNGERTYKINNGYVVGYALGGMLLPLLIVIYLLLNSIHRNNKPILVFILTFPFFSGHFVSIYLWFLLAFYINTKGEDS